MCATPAAVLAPSSAKATPSYGFDERPAVLVVEDDDIVAELIRRLLERAGYSVWRACDGATAERLTAEHAGDIVLVVLDCGLPDVNGGILSGRLRHLAGAVPILLMSGRDQAGIAQFVAATGPTGFLPKPFFPAQFQQQVRGLIGAIA